MIGPQIKIIAFNEDEELARYSLEPGEYTVGRSSSCNLQLKVEGVSREHARLIIGEDGNVALEDRGSANGTFVDQWRVRGRVNVHPNQTIKLGAVTLFFQESSAGSESGTPVSIAAGSETDLPAEFHRADRYDVGEELAKGGMGAILIARQATIRRTVAMKVMLGKAARSPRHRLRFIEEAQITGQLEHPNIVPVHELGVDADGQVFYTMKLVKGITLKKILQLLGKGVPETVAKYQLPALLTVFQKVCDALAFAHTKGVIHRDLKPANIMVGYFGEVLVMDWGLAKVVEGRELKIESPHAGSAEPPRPNLEHVSSARRDEGDVFATMDGAVIGTPHYMSPEQAGGDIDNLDARSDIFALGAILYELLTLELPFPGATVPEVLEKIKNGDVIPPHKIGKEVPESLSAVCMKALAHDPSQRYPRVKEFQADLTAYQAGFATGAETKSAWKQVKLFVRRHKSASIFGAAIVTLIVCFSIKLFSDRGRIINERNRAEKALGELKKTAPSLQQLADSEAALQRFDSALQKLDAALALDGSHLPSYWRRAWLLIGMERFPEAQQALLLAQKKDPRNTRNARILPIIIGMASAANDAERYKAENSGELISYLQQCGASGEMLALSKKLQISAKQKVQIIKSRLTEWLGGDSSQWLNVQVDGVVSVNLPAVSNLEPLRGLPIDKLTIGGGKKGPSSLEPLRGLRLIEISLPNTNINDLSPLKGMPLRSISLGGSKVTDLSPLRGAPLDAVYCAATNLIDMSPLRRAPLKRVLAGNNAIADLRFLIDAPIEELDLSANRIADLSFLRGKPLRKLMADGNSITDLRPLRGAPIEELSIAHQSQSLTDLSPLLDLPKLVKLRISVGSAKTLGALRKHPTLKYISVINHDNAPYAPTDEFWKEYDAKNKP